MEVEINNKSYNVVIDRKNNKNIYFRVKEDLTIYVTAPFLTSNKTIKSLIDKNSSSILKMINRVERLNDKKNYFCYLGKKYNIVIYNKAKEPIFDSDRVYVKDMNSLDRFRRNKASEVFNSRFKVCYELFEESISLPTLKMRKMKTKWGYCNKYKNLIMLNLELIAYSIDEIDYVIIHELCHLVYFDHSRNFWNLVSKYKPNYKENKKVLKEE